MAKKNHSSGAKTTTCNKCLHQAHAIPGSQHRRCPGGPDQPIRAKHEAIPSNQRGRWE
jgi:hypothetical protein